MHTMHLETRDASNEDDVIAFLNDLADAALASSQK